MMNDLQLLETKRQHHDFITPFRDSLIREDIDEKRVISYGLSSFGYDCRLDSKFKTYGGRRNFQFSEVRIDPKDFDASLLSEFECSTSIDLVPHEYILGRTLEHIVMPKDCVGLCIGKSTYARCGIVLNTTPLEPGWKGHLTLEIYNAAPVPVRLYVNEGICQLMFFKGVSTPRVDYASRSGKYQGHIEVTGPRV